MMNNRFGVSSGFIALAVIATSASAKQIELARNSNRPELRLERGDMPRKGANECVVFSLKDGPGSKPTLLWSACDFFRPSIFPWPAWSAAVEEAADGKTVYLVIARSSSLRTRITLFPVDKAKAKPVVPEIDEKGKLRNRAALEEVLRKPPFVLERDFAMVGDCGMDVKIRALNIEDSQLLIRASADDISATRKCEEFRFGFDLKSKKWTERAK